MHFVGLRQLLLTSRRLMWLVMTVVTLVLTATALPSQGSDRQVLLQPTIDDTATPPAVAPAYTTESILFAAPLVDPCDANCSLTLPIDNLVGAVERPTREYPVDGMSFGKSWGWPPLPRPPRP